MSMVVKNNESARFALVNLDKNNSALKKSIDRVSAGQKIVNAKDDSSAYSISEKMREQIRTMSQDSRNVQNGSALLKIAAGGIENIIDELRNLRELAINAANDTNGDNDRATMQKEFEQRVANISEIVASTNYNGITLMSGAYGIKVNGGRETADLGDLTRFFKPYQNAAVSGNLLSYCYIDGQRVKAHHSFDSSGGSPFKVQVSFSGLNAGSNPAQNLDNKGFIILCSGCAQYLNIKFDASTDESSYESNPDPNNSLAREYTIGIQSLTSLNDLPRAIFEGIKSSNSANDSAGDIIQIDPSHSVNMERHSDGTYTINKQAGLSLQFLTGSVENGHIGEVEEVELDPEGKWKPKTYSPFKIHHGSKANQAMNIYLNDMSIKYLRKRVIFDEDMDQLEQFVNDKEKYDKYKEFLISEKGVYSGDIDYLEKLRENDEQYRSYKEILAEARTKTLDDARVVTAHNAKVAMRIIDGALDYATEQAVQVGAYLQRLDYTDANLTTMNENVQSAESTIRDADMAKEMVDYTKNNILVQASQTMLAQANQNSSSVLGLLQ